MADMSLFRQVNSAGLQVDQAFFMMDDGRIPASAPIGGFPAFAPTGGFPASAPIGGFPASAPIGGFPEGGGNEELVLLTEKLEYFASSQVKRKTRPKLNVHVQTQLLAQPG